MLEFWLLGVDAGEEGADAELVPLASAGRSGCWPSASACWSPPDPWNGATPQLVIQRSWDSGASSEGLHHARTMSGLTVITGTINTGRVDRRPLLGAVVRALTD